MKAKLRSRLVINHLPADLFDRKPLLFRLQEPLEVEIDGQRYRAPRDLQTDGASAPRILRPLVPRVGRHIYASIIHDAGYHRRLEKWHARAWRRVELPRAWCDAAFYALMVAAGTDWLTRWSAYAGVRLFGRRAWAQVADALW